MGSVVSGPQIGPETAVGAPSDVCGYRREDEFCLAVASYRIFWGHVQSTGLACAEHAALARAEYADAIESIETYWP